VAKPCFNLSSNHSPVLITLTAHAQNQEKLPRLSNGHTNWDDFRSLINDRLTLNVSLKTKENIFAADKFAMQPQNIKTDSRHTTALY
jgi:hypothetical protein